MGQGAEGLDNCEGMAEDEAEEKYDGGLMRLNDWTREPHKGLDMIIWAPRGKKIKLPRRKKSDGSY